MWFKIVIHYEIIINIASIILTVSLDDVAFAIEQQ